MLGHDYVADEFESVAVSDLAKDLDKNIPCAGTAKKRQPTIATERNEMQMAEAVDAFQTLRHVRTKGPTLPHRGLGHPPKFSVCSNLRSPC